MKKLNITEIDENDENDKEDDFTHNIAAGIKNSFDLDLVMVMTIEQDVGKDHIDKTGFAVSCEKGLMSSVPEMLEKIAANMREEYAAGRNIEIKDKDKKNSVH